MHQLCQPKLPAPDGASRYAPVRPVQSRRAALVPALILTATALAVLLWGAPSQGLGV